MATIESPPNSVWPNGLQTDSEGYVTFYPLGTNKVNVPISSSEWPKGDKLISPFVYQDDKLVGFVDTKAFTTDSQTTTYLPYEHIEVEFSAIDKGQLEIYAPNATTKKVSWKNSGEEDIPEVQFKYKGCATIDDVKTVDANYLTTDIIDGVWSEPLWDLEHGGNKEEQTGIFRECSNLTSFSSNLLSLTLGYYMFYDCSNLTSFSSNLLSLTNGSNMFRSCDNLASFSSNLPSLTNSAWMFSWCTALTSFSSDLSSLTDGPQMFYGCSNLASFSSNLPKLRKGNQMFYNCKNLTSFTSNLPKLIVGSTMFYGCKLDAPSVKNIIDTINTNSNQLTLGMGCDNTTEDKDLFAQEVGYADMTTLLAALKAKRWSVTAQYNGRPTATYSVRRTSEDILPVFVKLEETEDYADYISIDGSKKYILDYFHETTDSTEGYTQYATLEEAIETLNIKPIERN